jgi:hypothetical protein
MLGGKTALAVARRPEVAFHLCIARAGEARSLNESLLSLAPLAITRAKDSFLLSDNVLQQCGMKRFGIFVVLTCTLIQIFSLDLGFAAGRKKKVSPAEQHEPVISNVSANSITVTNQKETRTFIVTPFIEINVNGQKGTIADLKSGMKVNVTIGVDPTRAGRIVASGSR